jgi:hypothetical protein
MLRYIFLAGFLFLNTNIVFSQVIFLGDFQEPTIHQYRQYHLPQWARFFADSTLRKVLVEPKKAGFLETGTAAMRNLPPGVRPADYIGHDGLPGDPLPAVYERPLPNVIWEKMRQHEVDDNMLRERIRPFLLDDK